MKEKIINFLNEKYKGSTRFIKPKMFIEFFGKDTYESINTLINWFNDPFSLKVFCFVNDILNKPICKICAEDVKFNPSEACFQKYCSNSCRFKDTSFIFEKTKKTNILKYGSENILASKYGMSKSKKTLMEKYGVDNYAKSEEYRNRIENGEIERTYSGNKISNSIKKRYYDNLTSRYVNLMPLFTFDEYKGAHDYDINYKWQCIKCEHKFEHWLNNNYNIKCPLCEKLGTSIEMFISNFLDKHKISYIRRSRSIAKNMELDIFIPSKNIAIECNGLYWHSDAKKDRKYHLNKTEKCLENNIKLIQIFSDEIELKPKQVLSRLCSILNLNKIKINARECVVKEIDHKLSSKFLLKYHLQGADRGLVRLGLFKGNRLLSLMTFTKSRRALSQKLSEGEYELSRYCSMRNVTIMGGAQKILSHFIKKHCPKKIMSFCDRRWSNGELYEKLNFILVKKTEPNYWYTKTFKERFHRFSFAKQFLHKKLKNFNSSISERENMEINGYSKVYDCGSLKYEFTI